MNNVMIDIETLGRSSTSVIVQIAAVEFNAVTGETGEEFVCSVDPTDCQKHGLTIDAATVLFWLKQSDEARMSVFESEEPLSLKDALLNFDFFLTNIKINSFDKPLLWANSPSFDIEILKHAYNKVGLKSEIDFRNERDFRTISKLFPEIFQNHKRTGIAHDALDDCKNQIAILSKCYQKIYQCEKN